MLKRISVGILAIIIYGIFLELGERLEIPGVHSFVSTAEAIIGRPLTPMSYAGVARRTARPVQWACTTARPRRPLGSVRSGLVSAVTRRATRVSANVAKLQVALEWANDPADSDGERPIQAGTAADLASWSFADDYRAGGRCPRHRGENGQRTIGAGARRIGEGIAGG